ncbi:carbonic anhydrase 12-like isoform X1 [Brienomyrus brachyistius]|uniref:carbonic anhydrase 12-like isoform X1 n=2 Tax=Brienomyrus brachyistius TaxID=42636 RepID=UPI0020B3247D|nr:carbonic anhydrase 12-like isoform X1 [Brienomyrus brachyistius]
MRIRYQPALRFAALFIFFVTTFSHGAAWTYTGPKGVQHWSKSYPFCGGVFQSPIDLQTPMLQYDSSLVPIEVHNYNLPAHEQLTLGNNGHAVKLYLPSKMYILGLPNRYSAVELHVHWGSPSIPAGSEHTIDGKRFAAELHVVHFNSDKYSNVSVATEMSDGLAVLAVLIEVAEFNPAFDQLLKFISGVKFRDQKVQVPAFNIRHLLPLRLDQYYRYDGSLTTPPCYPSVLWTVFRNPITISHTQFLTLATAIYSSREQEPVPVPLDGNYRTPQSTDERVILVSFREGWAPPRSLSLTPPITRRRVIQNLLSGDLGDLADDGISQLLPSLGRKLGVSSKPTGHNKQNHWRQNFPIQSGATPPFWKLPPATSSVGQLGLYEDSLCYVSIEQNVIKRLKGAPGGGRLVDVLREVLFPELNLRSYLHCRSELTLPTIRYLLRSRASDEAQQLERSLMKADRRPWKHPTERAFRKQQQSVLEEEAARDKVRPHPWPLGVEWED